MYQPLETGNRPLSAIPNPRATGGQVADAGSAPLAAPLIELQQVTKVYRRSHRGLLGVNLAVVPGSFLMIVGPSGAGKSTLLKLLYGEERADRGVVSVLGQDVGKLRGNRLAMLRRQMGIVFQDYKLIPRRTVAENISFALMARGYDQAEIQRRLLPTLKLVGLMDKADRYPEQLSGGEQQRVSLARAVVGTPPLILADEPTGNLDPDNARQTLGILERLHAYGATVVVTTHDELWVRRSDHPVWELRDGQLYQVR